MYDRARTAVSVRRPQPLVGGAEADRNDRQPVAIERAGVDRAVLIGAEELDRLLMDYEFNPEVFFEDDVVSVWLPELALYGRGETFDDAGADLVREVLDYVDEYVADAQLYLRAPNRAEHFPYVMKALVSDALGRLPETLFVTRPPVAAA